MEAVCSVSCFDVVTRNGLFVVSVYALDNNGAIYILFTFRPCDVHHVVYLYDLVT